MGIETALWCHYPGADQHIFFNNVSKYFLKNFRCVQVSYFIYILFKNPNLFLSMSALKHLYRLLLICKIIHFGNFKIIDIVLF